MSRIAPELLELLACPAPDCRAPLRQDAEHLTCTRCGRRYPIRGDWPTLIPEEAEPPTAEQAAATRSEP